MKMRGQSSAEEHLSPILHPSSCLARRGFLGRAAAWAVGGAAAAVPFVTGIVAFLNPLGQKSRSGEFLPLASLDMVPEDGTPKKFPVIRDHTDAWTHFPPEPIGAVFLRRVGGSAAAGTAAPRVLAFQVVCPHAGCAIDFQPSPRGGKFFCPCHSASFDLAGKRAEAKSPSPRDMDSLAVEIRNQSEVWVRFETFTVGTARKVAGG
jgi:menaquinol-cytochrome c reductase iron-sulfur subunit